MKAKEDINKTILELKKPRKKLISKKIYSKDTTTGAQPARLYGLAKVHKNETPLYPVQSISGSSYHKLNKFLTPLFEKVAAANIELYALYALAKLKKIIPDESEQIFPLEFKSLYTNVTASEAVEITIETTDYAPDIDRSTVKLLVKLAVTKVCLKSNRK